MCFVFCSFLFVSVLCSLFFVSKFSHFSLFHPSLFIQYSTEECSTVQLFIYKIIAVMIDIDPSWEWIAVYGPVQYSTVQYSTVQYITTVIIDNIGHGHRSQVTVTVTGHRSQVTGQRSRSQVTGHGHSGQKCINKSCGVSYWVSAAYWVSPTVTNKVRNIRFVWLLS